MQSAHRRQWRKANATEHSHH